MAICAIAMASFLILLDSIEAFRVGWIAQWTYAFGPESARAILSAIAGSMITVAGVTFSMTMLTLQLASSQFGPRMLRNFMRDRGNQVVLGMFLSTFVYCLLVLASVRGSGPGSGSFVPLIAVTFGMLLAVASLATLIYFIHHITTSIRIETILAKLAAEASATVERVFPEQGHAPVPTSDRALAEPCRPVSTMTAGPWSRRSAATSRRSISTGFSASPATMTSSSGSTAGSVTSFRGPDRWSLRIPMGGSPDAVAGDLRSMFSFGPGAHTTVRCRVLAQADRGGRAACLVAGDQRPDDGALLSRSTGGGSGLLSDRHMPSGRIVDRDLKLRVIFEPVGFADLACPAFAAIARYGIRDDDLVARLLDVMERCSRGAPSPDREKVMRLHGMIRTDSVALGLRGEGDMIRSVPSAKHTSSPGSSAGF
jgi:uncharacterized membrane protein